MGFFDDVARGVSDVGKRGVSDVSASFLNPEELLRRARNDIKDIGNTSKQYLGSAGYAIPVTALFQLGADYENQEGNKQRAEQEAEAARERLNQSTSAIDRLRAQQGVYAAGLKQNAARDYGLLSNQAASNERRAMAEKIRGAKDSAGGLVGSGFQKSAQARARAEAAGNTASKQKQIQTLLQEQINDAGNLQGQLALEQGGLQQNMADQYYQLAIQNMSKRNQSYSDILKAGSALAGTYAGSQRSA